jgi:hydrogenase/urease accessory protein HupE
MGATMNTDLALVLMGCTGAIFGFLVGYAKGHEHGKIQGKINARRILKSQVSR